MAENQMNPLPGRMTHRLTLDSSEEERKNEEEKRERQQYERQKEEKRKRKEERRKQIEEKQKEAKLEAEKRAEQRLQQMVRYNAPAKLFEADSSSGVEFSRAKRKIESMFPQFSKKRRRDSSSDNDSSSENDSNSESEQESESESEEEAPRKSHHQRKVEKKRNKQEEEASHKKSKGRVAVKVEHELSAKDKLVQDIAVRWWYALPEWPPSDYNYEQALRERGFRAVKASEFRFVDEVIDGLVKVAELDGFPGVYKGKSVGIVDVRPKQSAPSLNYFYEQSQERLHSLLKTAIQKQVQELRNVEHKQSGEEKLINDLLKRIHSLRS